MSPVFLSGTATPTTTTHKASLYSATIKTPPLGNIDPIHNHPQGIPLFRNQHFTNLGNTTPTHRHLQGIPPFRNRQNTPYREQRPHSQPPTRHSAVPHIQISATGNSPCKANEKRIGRPPEDQRRRHAPPGQMPQAAGGSCYFLHYMQKITSWNQSNLLPFSS